MWRGGAARSFAGMLKHTLTIAAIALLAPAPALAAGKTETLRFFSETESLVLTQANGTVVDKPPYPQAAAGDVLDIFAVDFKGDHKRHAAKPTASEHVRCTFSTEPEPECVAHVALGGSLLVFNGNTLVGGSNRYLGATGRVLSNKEVEGGSDVVARVTRAR
jgi:hypothetical protein